MPTVQHILAEKGNEVVTVRADVSVLEATQVMNRRKIGAVVVADGSRVRGMFTERDVLQRVVAEQRDPAATSVSDVMTRRVVCCKPDTPIDDVRSLMKNRRIRHLPVVDGGEKLVGLISIGDINAHHAHDCEVQIHYLEEYIYGRA